MIMSFCIPGNQCLILSRSRTGGVTLGRGYWSVPCVLCAVMMVCYADSPTVVWPSSSHAVTLCCTSQQHGCRNCARALFPSSLMEQLQCWAARNGARYSYRLWCLIVPAFWQQDKAFLCVVHGQVLQTSKHFEFPVNTQEKASFLSLMFNLQYTVLHADTVH